MTTLLDALIDALRDAAAYNRESEAPPEAVVWCDANNEFASLIPALRERVPELLTYGDYDPAMRAGPAVWLRAAAVKAIDGVNWPDGATPIVYLPGVGRETLKGAEDCPQLLQPLVWLSVSGALFGHVNGKDWTLRAFLVSERGTPRLRINDDAATRSALSAAATRLFSRPLEELRTKSWDADQLNSLLAPDLDADMLDWIDGQLIEAADPARFQAFASLSTKQLNFDPRKLNTADAVKRLAKREGRWQQIWARFDTAIGYEGVVVALGLQEPTSLFDYEENADAYPRLNNQGELKLREALMSLSELSLEDARARIHALEKENGWRRETKWARRGESPLAQALSYLVTVASAKPLPTHEGGALAEAYLNQGCTIDWAAMQALASASRQIDREAVVSAIRAIYLPWLEDGALALQELLRSGKLKLSPPPLSEPNATTILFVDGFRMDLARELERQLKEHGLTVSLNWSWSGFPTVTATCKPMVMPVAHLLSGPAQTSDVLPLTPDGKPANKSALYKLMKGNGWETDSALLVEQKLWAETADFDEEGHALGAKLAERLVAGIVDTADVVMGLVRSGRKVRIVTDHGWLLMPGGLPVAALDIGLTEANGKRTRCAMVKSRAETTYLQIPWTWNDQVYVAAATGVRSFYSAYEYAHGGISPQECVLPVMDISGNSPNSAVSITEARWDGLRLRLASSGGADLRVDIRLGQETSGVSLLRGNRVLDETGKTSILLTDEHEGKAALIVIVDDHDRVVAQRTTKVGGE